MELDKAGFEVQHKAAAGASDGLKLEGQLWQFFVEPKVGAFTFTPEADVHVRLSATSASRLKAERSFYVKWEETSMVGTDDNFQTAVDKATSGAVINMAQAVQELLQRYPELKTRTSTQSVACARHVVMDPDKAAEQNSQDWTIKQEPRKSPPPAR